MQLVPSWWSVLGEVLGSSEHGAYLTDTGWRLMTCPHDVKPRAGSALSSFSLLPGWCLDWRKPQAAPAGAASTIPTTTPSRHDRRHLTQNSEPKNKSSIKLLLIGHSVIVKKEYISGALLAW